MSCNKSVNIFLLGLASSMKTDIRTSDSDQEQIMTFAYAFPVTIMVAVAIGSNIISIDTFRRAQLRSTTVGLYLLVHSCCALFGMFMLQCRLFQLLDSLTYIPFFIICNVVSGLASIFTRICLWMIGLIALQRSLYSFEHNRLLDKIRSRAAAPIQILVIILCIFSMHVHELICRVTLPDPIVTDKFVCQIKYSSELLVLNKVFTFMHLFVPFSLNILANCLILASISRRRATLHRTTYWAQWLKQFRCHGHLFAAPTFAMVKRSLFLSLFLTLYSLFLFEGLHIASIDTSIEFRLCRCHNQMATTAKYLCQFNHLLTSSRHILSIHLSFRKLSKGIPNGVSVWKNFSLQTQHKSTSFAADNSTFTIEWDNATWRENWRREYNQELNVTLRSRL